MASSTKADVLARVLGILVFLLGVGIILLVLRLALQMWESPTLGLGGSAADLAALGRGFGMLIVRIGLLFLAAACGSMIANKGINLYFSALHVRDRDRSDTPRPAPEPPRVAVERTAELPKA